MQEIIGLSGWARSGKDTVADYLVEHHGFVKLSLATPMREALYNLNPTVLDWTNMSWSLQQAVHLFGWEEMKTSFPSVRGLMQRMGTEVGRQMFGEDFWVDLTIKEANKYDKVVIADCRYLNEADAVRTAGGQVWRISRDSAPAANDHDSEHGLDDYAFDLKLDNNNTIEELHKFVEELVNGR
jgi:hypothetical protein